ncbi:MAG: molecular chaperone DnaJ [Candidatus Diapherotrites archaeon]
MPKHDYYEILGLAKGASPEEVKRAYKDLAKKFHPDVNREAGAEDKFKEVLEAYTVLSDPQKRQQYDQFGFEGQHFGGAGGFDFSDLFRGGGMPFEDLFEGMGFGGTIFENLFGGERQRRGPVRGSDLRYDLELNFEEAVFGTEKEIDVPHIGVCDECNGSGAAEKASIVTCLQCGGRGVVERAQRTPFGVFSTRTTCGKCRGSGKVIKNPCKKCAGNGRVRARKKINVKIPAGIDSGFNLRLKGIGNADGESETPGDLYVVVFVKPSTRFRRDGADLFETVFVGFADAALGAEAEVPTLRGKAKLKVPAGTQTSTVFRMKGLGVKEFGGRTGDLFVKVKVKVPEKLSRKEKELIEKLREEDAGKKGKAGFFNFG